MAGREFGLSEPPWVPSLLDRLEAPVSDSEHSVQKSVGIGLIKRNYGRKVKLVEVAIRPLR